MISKNKLLKKSIRTLIVSIASMITLFPIYWMIQMSLKTHRDALRIPPNFIFRPQISSYLSAWNKLGFSSALLNSLIVAALSTIIALVFGLLAAYAFSRYRFWGDKIILFFILVTRIFPPIAIIIPLYLNLRNIGGYDTYWGLSLGYLALNIPLAIWMLKGYFDSIPVDLEHCAMIDGANRFQAVTRITLPLVAPGVVATSIFTFIISWNEFLFALILTSKDARTLPVTISEFVGETGVHWPEIMAASVIAIVPVITFSIFVQRHLVKGLASGALD